MKELLHEYLEPNSTISIGTGTLSYSFIKQLAYKLLEERLKVQVIPSGVDQALLLHDLKIPLTSLNDHEVDVAIMFADRCTKGKDFVKTNSDCLIIDKMIAQSANQLIVLSHLDNFVPKLNGWIPFEISHFGYQRTLASLMNLGSVKLREKNNLPVKTLDGNLLVDVQISSDYSLQDIDWISKHTSGVLENGLFQDLATEAIVFHDKVSHKLVRIKK